MKRNYLADRWIGRQAIPGYLDQNKERGTRMNDSILIGRQDKTIAIPADAWRQHLAQAQQHGSTGVSFMTDDHHRVRDFVVSELPRNDGKPPTAEAIAPGLLLASSREVAMLDDVR